MSELLTVHEVATVLKCSPKSVIRRFERRAGVVDLNPPTKRRTRRSLRIPRTVLEKFIIERTQ
jgi:hypothetical protein